MVAGFHFRLQRLLDVQLRYEEQAEVALAQALRAHAAARQRVELAHHHLMFARRNKRTPLGPVSITRLRQAATHVAAAAERLQEAQADRATLEKLVAERRNALVAVSRKRQMLERLRERAETDYRRSAHRREQTYFDEVASSMWAQSGAAEGMAP